MSWHVLATNAISRRFLGVALLGWILSTGGVPPARVAPERAWFRGRSAAHAHCFHQGRVGAVDGTQEDVPALAERLRTGHDAARAALLTVRLLGSGEAGRAALAAAIRERAIPEGVLRGVHVAIAEHAERDATVVQALLAAFLEESRASYRMALKEGIGEIHQLGSVLPSFWARFESAENGTRAGLIDLLRTLPLTSGQLAEVVAKLIPLLEGGGEASVDARAKTALEAMTGECFETAEQWRSWLEEFRASRSGDPNPRADREAQLAALRAELALVKSQAAAHALEAVRAAHRTAIREVSKGDVPNYYLDPKSMPDAAVRAWAAEALAAFAGTDAKRQDQALLALAGQLETDAEPVVRQASLGCLAQIGRRRNASPEVAARLRAQLEPLLRAATDPVELERIVLALRVVGDPAIADLLHETWRSHGGPAAAGLRRAIVAVVFALNQREPHRLLVDALSDRDPQVQIFVANSLAQSARAEHAPALARALQASTDERVRERLVAALRQINDFRDPDVRNALIAAAGTSGSWQLGAIQCMARMVANGLPDDVREVVATELLAVVPKAPAEVRSGFAVVAREAKSAALSRIAARVLEKETQPAVATEFAQALLAAPESEPRALLEIGRKLDRTLFAAARLLLERVVARGAAPDATEVDKSLSAEAKPWLIERQLEAKDAAAASVTFASIPVAARTGPLASLRLRIEEARGDRAAALRAATEGLDVPSLARENVVAFREAQVRHGLSSPIAADHVLGCSAFEALEKLGVAEVVAALRPQVEADVRARDLVQQLDSLAGDPGAVRDALVSIGPGPAAWLLEGLSALSMRPPAESTVAIQRRLEVLRLLMPHDVALRDLPSPDGSKPDSIKSACDALLAWWAAKTSAPARPTTPPNVPSPPPGGSAAETAAPTGPSTPTTRRTPASPNPAGIAENATL